MEAYLDKTHLLMKKNQFALAGLLAPTIFWITYAIHSNRRPAYSFLTKVISELGSLDAPNKWTWNISGYIIPGLLISVYSFGLFKAISTDQGSKWPMIGFVLCGLFMALSGIFPGDFDNRQSATMVLHVIGSFGSYIFFLVGAFSYPKQMKKSDYWKTAVKPTLLFTWLTILFGVWPYIFPTMPAVGQRVIFFFFFLWVFYTAIKLIKMPSRINE